MKPLISINSMVLCAALSVGLMVTPIVAHPVTPASEIIALSGDVAMAVAVAQNDVARLAVADGARAIAFSTYTLHVSRMGGVFLISYTLPITYRGGVIEYEIAADTWRIKHRSISK